jgi:hypothetical protein
VDSQPLEKAMAAFFIEEMQTESNGDIHLPFTVHTFKQTEGKKVLPPFFLNFLQLESFN